MEWPHECVTCQNNRVPVAGVQCAACAFAWTRLPVLTDAERAMLDRERELQIRADMNEVE